MPGRYVRPTGNPKQTLIFILIAGAMMIVVDLFVFGGIHYIMPKRVPVKTVGVPVTPEVSAEKVTVPKSSFVLPEVIDHVETILAEDALHTIEAPSPKVEVLANSEKWQEFAVAFEPAAGDLPKIVIILDDLGIDKKRSKRAVDLPGPLTLAYLPYATHVEKQTEAAREAGHELLIHTPMEPMSSKQNPGPMALLDDMSHDEIETLFTQILDSFDGYVGINNHMGSKLTQNPKIMRQIMLRLKDKGLIFIDSKTISGSVAAKTAKDMGLYYAERDVFLDHENNRDFVEGALKKLELVARQNGIAIAIGHPKDVTIDALEAWLPTLEEKGFQLAPVSAVIQRQILPDSRHAQLQ